MPSKEIFSPASKEAEYNRFLISEYLRLESVDAVYQEHNYNIHVSPSTFHRLVNNWAGQGIVKRAGPNSNMSEVLMILSELADTELPLETFYRDHLPYSLRYTLSTSYRVLQKIKEGTIRRLGTALIITPQDNPSSVLLANDISVSNPQLGHSGDLSLPVGYSKHKEPAATSIRRVLEREVFTQKVIDQTFPYHLIPQDPQPLGTITIADIHVKIYHLELPAKYLRKSQLSSFKLVGHHLTDLDQLASLNPSQKGIRPGIIEILKHYQQLLTQPETNLSPASINCQLNHRLALAYAEK